MVEQAEEEASFTTACSCLKMVARVIKDIFHWMKEILKTLFVFGFILHVILLLACCYSNFESVKENYEFIVPGTVLGFTLMYIFD